jgi:hypothetical protein
MEPQGIVLRPAEGITWTSQPLCNQDKALMDIAVTYYDKKRSACINRCRQFLQVISVLDLVIPHTNTIHPSYLDGYLPPSRSSYITWLAIPRPPQKYWKIWNHFIHMYIRPVINDLDIGWNRILNPRFHPNFYKHSNTVHLYI